MLQLIARQFLQPAAPLTVQLTAPLTLQLTVPHILQPKVPHILQPKVRQVLPQRAGFRMNMKVMAVRLPLLMILSAELASAHMVSRDGDGALVAALVGNSVGASVGEVDAPRRRALTFPK